jgi:hypothetical protein
MGDRDVHIIQIKGTAYKFKPIPANDAARVILVINMGASMMKPIKAIMSVLSESAGEEQWDAITDRLIAKELTIEDVSSKLFKKLIDKQKADEQPTKGLDVASRTLRPADDAE